VHPTKREVRFAEDGPVFSLVAAVAARPLATLHPPFTVVPGGAGSAWADRVSERPADPDQLTLGPLSPRVDAATPAAAPPAAREPRTLSEPEMWQLHRTYILAPVRGGLVIIDQHAAHERILYEQALARFQGAEGASQQLLFPALVDLSRSQFERLLEIGPWLHQLGWDLTLLGPPSVVIRGVPGEVRTDAPGPFLEALLDDYEERLARHPHLDVVEHLARSHACHTAIKAGDALQPAEMSSLVNRLFGTSRPHGDPHGRVTYVRLDLEELHRRFGRS
jgi:DNA mismatch repair protein MutL